MAAIRAPRPVKGALAPKWTPSFLGLLVDDAEEPPPVAVGLVSGLAFPVMQVLTPLMTPLSWAWSNKSQMVVLVDLVWTLDPPRTSVSEGSLTLDQELEITPLRADTYSDLPIERTGEVESTHDGLQLREAVDSLEVGVVGNQEATTNLSEGWEREVAQLRAVNNSQSTTGLGQVGSGERLEGVGVETHGACYVGKRGQVNLAHVSESQVGRIFKVGKADLQIATVGREREGSSDVGQIVDIDICEVGVVVDIHASNSSQFDAVDIVQLRVGNIDLV